MASSSALTVIEAARISAIIEEALEKLSFLASITPDVMAHRDELSQIVGDEITRIIQEQRGLETRYEQLIGQRTQLKALSNKTKFQENQEQVKEVAKALRESTKELCRNLKGNPNIAENLTKIQTERSNLQNLLSKTLRELRECSFATLTTTVDEEKARNDMIKEVVQKEKEVSAAVKKLQADLANEKLLHAQEVEERNEIIAKLKEELVAVRTKSSIETKYLHKVARARGQSLNRAYGSKTSDLEQQIWHVKKELEIEVRANGETEEFLRKKQTQLTAEIQQWMQKYDEDIEEQEKILEQLKESRAADLIKLNDYTERESKELEEKARRDEAARMKAEADRLRRLEEEKNLWAATRVQALWRGYLQRKAAAGGGKKGKKGKKGASRRRTSHGLFSRKFRRARARCTAFAAHPNALLTKLPVRCVSYDRQEEEVDLHRSSGGLCAHGAAGRAPGCTPLFCACHRADDQHDAAADGRRDRGRGRGASVAAFVSSLAIGRAQWPRARECVVAAYVASSCRVSRMLLCMPMCGGMATWWSGAVRRALCRTRLCAVAATCVPCDGTGHVITDAARAHVSGLIRASRSARVGPFRFSFRFFILYVEPAHIDISRY